MKYIITILFAIFFLVSCKKLERSKTVLVQGIVYNSSNNQPFYNSDIYINATISNSSGFINSDKTLKFFHLKTDQKGAFQTSITYKKDNDFFEFDKIIDNQNNISYPKENKYLISDIEAHQKIILYAKPLLKMDIEVKNTKPYDENDAVYFYIIPQKANYNINIINNIQNFGLDNESNNLSKISDQSNPFWVGCNVNSIIHASVQENISFIFYWNVRKNGIWKKYASSQKTISINSKKQFQIFY